MAEGKLSSGSTRRVAAWSVHFLSASGVVLAFLSLSAVIEHRWTEALVWLLVALAVDGIDGSLARSVDVKSVVPRIDGGALDLVIDYLTYVFVPALFMVEASILPPRPAGTPLVAAILVSSLYVFARRDMKTADGYFRGFPALWNVVAIYLFAAGLSGATAVIIVLTLAVLSFAPVHFVHPFRVKDFGAWLPLTAMLWAASTLALVLGLGSRPILLSTSAIAASVLVGLGLWRTARGVRRRPVDLAAPLR